MRIRRIQSSLIESFAVLIVFTIVLLGAVSIYFFKKTIVGIAEQNTMQLVSQLNRVIDNYITYMDDIALVLVNNADVKAYMGSPERSPPRLRRRIGQFLGSVKTVRRISTASSSCLSCVPAGMRAPVLSWRPRRAGP